MAQGSDSYHEPIEWLSQDTLDTHRALVSFMEELEAIDWYQQRADACVDEELKAILLHNKEEEVEHAMMTLEWLIRRHPLFAQMARTYLFSQGPITDIEEADTSEADEANKPDKQKDAGRGDGSLGIGSLRKR